MQQLDTRARSWSLLCFAGLLAVLTASGAAVAQGRDDRLPDPLTAHEVVALATQRRAEILAARARARAAAERPRVVAALNDPMVMLSIDHLPFRATGADGSLTVQQEFPLSSILSRRRRSAEAEAQRWSAEASRVTLDVELDAVVAFYGLAWRRATVPILDEQIQTLTTLAELARAHLASGQALQSDVLRLETESARLLSERRALEADIRRAEASMNTSLARLPDAPIPSLAWNGDPADPPSVQALLAEGLQHRPELAGARAERARAEADIEVMRSMYSPMAIVRAGPSYTMQEGPGVMVMLGLSVPIWRDRLAGGVAEAEWMAEMSRSDLTALERAIRGEIAAAREEVAAERARWIALRDDVLPRTRSALDSTTGGFASGQVPMLNVLETLRDLRDVRMQEIEVRARLGIGWARIVRAVGRPQ